MNAPIPHHTLSEAESMPKTLAYALAYIEKGWHVFPLRPIDPPPKDKREFEKRAWSKEPFGKLAQHGALSATSDPATARRWWTAHPDCGIGIALEPSGLILFDVDPRNGGAESFAELEAAHGPITSDVHAFSGRGDGGFHLYFANHGAFQPGLEMPPGIDLKHNGYAAAPPTLHPASYPDAKSYEWEASSDPIDGWMPSPLPDWLASASHKSPARAEIGRLADFPGMWVPEATLIELRSALGSLRADDYTQWVAVGHALRELGDKGRALWVEWSQTSGKFQPEDVRKWDTFAPGSTGYQAVFAKAQQAGWVNPAKGGYRGAPFDVSGLRDMIDAGRGLADFGEVDQDGRDKGPILKPVSVADVLTNPAPPPEMVWEGYAPRGVICLWGAHGGTGKSLMAMMLAVAVVTGRPLFGASTKQGNALFVSLEDDAPTVRHRLGWICRSWAIDPAALDGRLHIVDGTENPELFAAEGRNDAGMVTPGFGEAYRLAASIHAVLVVVDNASDAYGGDEIQRRQVRGFMRALNTLARRTGCAVVLLSHVDKGTSRGGKPGNSEGYSGSTAWHNSARSRLFMSRDDKTGLLTLEHQKSNLTRRKDAIDLTWPDDGLPMLVDEVPDFTGLIPARVQGRTDDESTAGLLRILAEFEGRGQYASPAQRANNNVHALLRAEPSFQRLKLGKDDTARIVNQCQRAGWIEVIEYRTTERKAKDRWTVTEKGREFANIAPAAPAAPALDVSAQSAESARAAPAAPACVGGYRGDESAHAGALNDPTEAASGHASDSPETGGDHGRV